MGKPEQNHPYQKIILYASRILIRNPVVTPTILNIIKL
ncbi:hypothetical protein LEP1GSC052_3778 [Leptospira kmetyi serovar Malaysia str. Bejo-Iso9]|nr:hypothetical protein LEP1GSC052_3778 [Leptospira kmetyi serovar Malaysia str. Bejo-Iso9]